MLSKNLNDEYVRRYVFKLHPTTEQAAVLHRQRYMMGQLWNALLQRCEDAWRRSVEHDGRAAAKGLTFFDLTNEITILRHECPEWTEVPAITAHRVAYHLTEAFKAFFRRLKHGEKEAGYPRYKKAALETTIPLGTMNTTGWTLVPSDNPRSWQFYYLSTCNRRDRNTWIYAGGRLPTAVADRPQAWRNADIICRDGAWWLSVCVCISPRSRPHATTKIPVTVEFGILDGMARVNGRLVTPAAFGPLWPLSDQLRELKSERDQRYPRRRHRTDEEQCAYLAMCYRIERLERNLRRRRHDALHVWTTGVVRQASEIVIMLPPIQPNIATPRGTANNWGAAVKEVSAINREVLFAAPATATAMIRYKAQEAGIPCVVNTPLETDLTIGQDLVAAGKSIRRATRAIKKAAQAA